MLSIKYFTNSPSKGVSWRAASWHLWLVQAKPSSIQEIAARIQKKPVMSWVHFLLVRGQCDLGTFQQVHFCSCNYNHRHTHTNLDLLCREPDTFVCFVVPLGSSKSHSTSVLGDSRWTLKRQEKDFLYLRRIPSDLSFDPAICTLLKPLCLCWGLLTSVAVRSCNHGKQSPGSSPDHGCENRLCVGIKRKSCKHTTEVAAGEVVPKGMCEQ